MNRTKRLSALFIALMLVFLTIAEVSGVLATETPTNVKIEFVGDDADKAGFAESRITVIPGDGCALDGYYLVYYTDGSAVLPDYDEITAIKVNDGREVKAKIKAGMMLPPEAKGIAVFESKTRFLDTVPDLSDAVATAEIPEEKRFKSLGEPEFRFGALSDTHMNYEPYNRGAFAKLEYSLKFFAERNMDCIIITGDVVGDRGENPDLEAQYEKHNEILSGSGFDVGKIYESTGNHGNTPADVGLFTQYLTGDNEIHPYEDSPYYHVLFDGGESKRDNLFIFMWQELKAPGDTAAYDNFSKEQIDWLESLLDEYSKTETNIYLIIHAPFLKYGAGDIANGSYGACITFKKEFAQTMRLKELLENNKDVIVMSGHTHCSFYDNANYSNVNGKFAHTVHIGSNCQPCGYGEESTMVRSFDGRHEVTVEYGSEGYTVDVYREYIVYTGYNFSTGKKIPSACFIIPTNAPPLPQTAESAPADDTANESKLPLGLILGIGIGVAAIAAGIAFFLIRRKKSN